MKSTKITAKFATETKVELTIGSYLAVVDTPHRANARQLAALAEAGLLDVHGDELTVRVREAKIKDSDKIVTETRHGNLVVIVEPCNGQRRLIHIYDIERVSNN